ncbi:hypothetical protein DNTS_030903 [Danionella cerebrum]|nr:hypothetical protein DNTS_030903 [Danionella translucida]TRZ03893.1 hypothetical protein DNTS_030903 [Danionella translucida]
MKPLESSKRQSPGEKRSSECRPEKDSRSEGDDVISAHRSLESLLMDLTKVNNSRDRASRLFQWLVHPVLDKNFFRDNWEKRPILIQRRNADYYRGLFSTAEFDRILRNRGCSLRVLNPQAFSPTVWQVLSILQEKFGSMAGANVYLTPPGTQGFAPHFDDIEAFIIQLEGKKHWRVYNPRSEEEVLSLISSPNFSQTEIGKPILDVVLEAGDLLYFPRGFVHQGDCLQDAHSLHITISSYQRNSWGDLMLKEDPRRDKFLAHVQGLIKKLVRYAPVDAAVDQKAKDFLHDCLPPLLSAEEKAGSVFGAPTRWGDDKPLDVGIQLKVISEQLCSDGDQVFLFYTTENSRVYHKEEPKSMEMKTEQHIDAMEFLIHSYPNFVTVTSLPCDTANAKISLAEDLFERGLIITAE